MAALSSRARTFLCQSKLIASGCMQLPCDDLVRSAPKQRRRVVQEQSRDGRELPNQPDQSRSSEHRPRIRKFAEIDSKRQYGRICGARGRCCLHFGFRERFRTASIEPNRSTSTNQRRPLDVQSSTFGRWGHFPSIGRDARAGAEGRSIRFCRLLSCWCRGRMLRQYRQPGCRQQGLLEAGQWLGRSKTHWTKRCRLSFACVSLCPAALFFLFSKYPCRLQKQRQSQAMSEVPLPWTSFFRA
eukprot:11206_3